MENIKLTEEHKCKLLEMCNSLFPEYHSWQFGNRKIAADDELWFYDKQDKFYEIHWFEFCMIHLANKLFKNKMINRDSYYNVLYNIIYQDFESEFNHIIDYLYKEFKKLK